MKSFFQSFFRKRYFSLVLSVVISSSLLTVVNFYTIKTTSAVRAYINGESRYSKGQKDASRHLIIYLTLQNEQYYKIFNEELKVPLGDSLARVELSQRGSDAAVRLGFLQGKNHEDDIDNMIWLFKNFEFISFMQEGIKIWKEADVLIGQLKELGDEVYTKGFANSATMGERAALIKKINVITTELTIKERAFSDLMGATARKINVYLFYFNFIIVILIITSIVAYSYRDFRQIMRTQQDLAMTNKNLNEINREMDNFIYAASHDLKSPINNLEGLMGLLKQSIPADGNQMTILEKMGFSIASLRKTINGLTEVMRIDKDPMEDITDNVFEQHLEEFKRENQHLLQEVNVTITSSLKVEKISYSTLGLRSIIQNLLTNAIKYHSPKRNCIIKVNTLQSNNSTILEVHDNGLGIDLKKNGHKLFKLFARLHDHVEGTGLGLYMIKRIIEKQGGTIQVESNPDVGTSFFITLKQDAKV